MHLLASIEGQVVFLVIAGIVGFFNWLKNKSDARPMGVPSTLSKTRERGTTGDDEAERMRKFLEALGVPADQGPAPVKHPVARRKKPTPPPPLPRPRVRSLDELDAPTLSVEQLHIPELRTPEMPEFHTLSARVSAVPGAPGGGGERDAYAADVRARPENDLRALLKSPRDLRSALVLREILGPPRSLQSS